jgi:hypothetical protein
MNAEGGACANSETRKRLWFCRKVSFLLRISVQSYTVLLNRRTRMDTRRDASDSQYFQTVVTERTEDDLRGMFSNKELDTVEAAIDQSCREMTADISSVLQG